MSLRCPDGLSQVSPRVRSRLDTSIWEVKGRRISAHNRIPWCQSLLYIIMTNNTTPPKDHTVVSELFNVSHDPSTVLALYLGQGSLQALSDVEEVDWIGLEHM